MTGQHYYRNERWDAPKRLRCRDEGLLGGHGAGDASPAERRDPRTVFQGPF